MKAACHAALVRRGYTLIEVLAAAAVIAVGTGAAVSLSSSLMLQEELAWRVAITRNYQENMARLWQLGINPDDVMPTQRNSARLDEAIHGTPVVTETGTVNPEGLGLMQAAEIDASVNVASEVGREIAGSNLKITAYRPALPSSLRITPNR